MNFQKGSEWRKWDLHVHTKNTAKNDQFISRDFSTFCFTLFKKALEKEIAVIGITDYFSIENYRKVKEFISNIDTMNEFNAEEKKSIKNISIMPNVELRMLPVTNSGRLINIHCIFNPLFEKSIENDFFGAIQYSAGSGKKYPMNKQGLIDLGKSFDSNLSDELSYKRGIDTFVVSHESLQKLLDENINFRENVIIVVSNSSRDGASALQKHYDLFEDVEPGSLDAVRRSIYCISQAIFSRNDEDRKYFLGKKRDNENSVKAKCGSLKPCIHGSDAHTEEKLFSPDLERFCWIKADPTFEGLKQIIYEPDTRVKIQKDNPDFEYNKRYFSGLNIKGKIFDDSEVSFVDQEIPFNRNLVTLIGGRGTGKSVLLNCLKESFNRDSGFFYFGQNNAKFGQPNLKFGQPKERKIHKDLEFKIEIFRDKAEPTNQQYSIKDNDNAFEYLHVSQSEIKKVVESPDKLNEEIRKLLGLREDKYDQIPEEDIKKINFNILELEKELFQRDEFGNIIDLKSNCVNEKKRYSKLIETITTEETKSDINLFTENTKKIQELSEFIKYIQSLLVIINNFEKEICRYESGFKQILKSYKFNSQFSPDINFENIYAQLEDLKKEAETKIIEIDNIKTHISKKLIEKGLKDDVGSLLDKISEYHKEIEKNEEKLKIIKEKEEKLIEIKKERANYVKIIKDKFENEKKKIDNSFEEIKRGKESWSNDQKSLITELLKDITITAEIYFGKNEFFNGLKDILNMNKLKQRGDCTQDKRLEETFNVSDSNTFFNLLEDKEQINLEDKEQINIKESNQIKLSDFTSLKEYFKGDSEANSIYDYLYIKSEQQKYLKIIAKLQYKGKAPEKLSVGQKGTFYLCLKLATDPFITPFVFDQPEDDLDNNFIMQELVPIFRRIKKYRQVIIATHNANLVVNTDAEQNVVANNENETLSYTMGSLENPDIKANIISILEGGDTAFKNREQKYGIK